MPKLRADLLLVSRGLAESREAAQRLISAGRVKSGTTTFVKASQTVDADAPLEVTEPERYVSRGGLKLEGALEGFGIDVSGRVCLDLGASTGGFTDCLLQHGAVGVIAVDVGRAQLHQRLREDPRVRLLEQTNARALPELERTNDELRRTPGGERAVDSATFDVRRSSIGFFCADLSFISLRKVLPSVAFRLRPGSEGVVLLKPQFEAGPKDVPRGGVIKDEAVVSRVREEFVSWLVGEGWAVYGMIASPIRGGDGNREFLVHVATPSGPETTNDELRTTRREGTTD
jgi:23S rRNA (cytidine1920-2'-O)/16S rRNA (cytidine1409-2'-O)-methyltransferase